MTQALNIERLLDEWLAEGPRIVPDRVVDGAIADIASVRQVRAGRGRPAASRFAGFATAAAVVIAITGALALFMSRNMVGGPTTVPAPPSSSATRAPSASPTPLESLRALSNSGPVALLPGTAMEAGATYTVSGFDPSFTIAGQPGWQLSPPQGTGFVQFQAPGDSAELTIIRPSQAIDSYGNVIPLPPKLADWLIAQPDLYFDRSVQVVPPMWNPTPVTVGGALGVDLGTGSIPRGTERDSQGVVSLLCSSDGPCNRDASYALRLTPGWVFSLVVLSVNGEPVVVAFDAIPDYTDIPFQSFESSLQFASYPPLTLLPGTTMEAGKTYASSGFEPAFTIAGQNGWQVAPQGGEGPAHVTIQSPGDHAEVNIVRPDQVVSDQGNVMSLPANLAYWLASETTFQFDSGWWIDHRSWTSSKPPPATELGGATGYDLGGGVVSDSATPNANGQVVFACSADAPCSNNAQNQMAVTPGRPFALVVLQTDSGVVIIETESDAADAVAAHQVFGQFGDSLHFLP